MALNGRWAFALTIFALLGAACGGEDPAANLSEAPLLGVVPTGIGFQERDRIVGMGMAGSTGNVYAWTAAYTVSAGIPANLGWHKGPYRFSTPSGLTTSEIVGMGITTNDRVYTWYSNGTRSVGSSADLDSVDVPRAYVIPGGRSPSNIVAMAIVPDDDYVVAWYDDGYVSIGDSRNLGSRTGPGRYWPAERAYTHAPGRSASGLVGIAIQPGNHHVFAWYSDGFFTEGTTRDLDAYSGPTRYARHAILKGVFPTNPLPVGSYEVGETVPTRVAALDINTGSADNMVAAGHKYFAVSFDSSVKFYRRDGSPLTGGALTGNNADLNAMFAPFMRLNATPGPLDVNQFIGFPRACDSYPATRSYHFCVSETMYDTRVEYDAIGRRFVIYGNMRNPLWTNAFSADPTKTYDTGWVSEYPDAAGVMHDLGSDGVLTRRLKAVAISRSEDPRDGFYTYVFLQNDVRDWPWMAINGEWLVLAHAGAEHVDAPVATLLPLDDLRAGATRPEFINYDRNDLQDAVVAEPPRQYGSLATHSLLVGKDGAGAWRVFALPHPALNYAKVAPGSATMNPSYLDPTELARERFAFRDGYLHVVGSKKTVVSNGKQLYEVAYNRARVTMSGDTPVFHYSSGDHREAHWSDQEANVDLSYEEPMVAVNGRGDVLVVMGESGLGPAPLHIALGAHVLRAVWRAGQWAPDAPVVWRAGDGGWTTTGHNVAVKALGGAVDPNDDQTFWGINKFVNTDGTWDTFVGAYTP